jgi:hypothetical protein
VGKIHPIVDDALAAWLGEQHVFFVATAPSGDGGHVNCSPKGRDSFRVLGPTTVAYRDFTGSGIETVAHVRANGRIVLMFCAFEGAPRIVRLHGRGEVVTAQHEDYAGVQQRFGRREPGVRAIVRVELTRIADSCGFGVPLLRYEGERDTLQKWVEQKGEDGVARYVRDKNATSIDGLPGLSAR